MSKRIEEKEEYQRVIVTTEAKKTPDSYFPQGRSLITRLEHIRSSITETCSQLKIAYEQTGDLLRCGAVNYSETEFRFILIYQDNLNTCTLPRYLQPL
jgi:hypothetical protein